MKKGVLIDDISCQMNWQDFECLVAEILESKNFVTRKNIVLKKPRRQIDVVGSRLGVTMIIDCKHWKRYSSSALRNVVKNQIERSKHYLTNTKGTIGICVSTFPILQREVYQGGIPPQGFRIHGGHSTDT